MIVNSGQLTQAEAILFNATIIQGIHEAIEKLTDNRSDIVANKIALMRPIVIDVAKDDPLSKRIPAEMVFPFNSAICPQAEDLTSQDRPFVPLIESSIRLPIKPYGIGYWITRRDFYNDLFYTLAQVPKKLTRGIMKIVDVKLAGLLRDGCTGFDGTGKPYFATDKFGKRGNLFKKMPLNRKNLIAGLVDMLSRRTAENGDCEVPPDTLIVPPTLFAAASKAVGLRNFVNGYGVTPVNRKKRNKDKPLSMIKQVICMPELLSGGKAVDQTTWYLASCMSAAHGGPCGLLVAVEDGFEYLTNLSPSDPEVFYRNRFAFGSERYAGFAYGNGLFMSRFEAEGDSTAEKPVEAAPAEPTAKPPTVPVVAPQKSTSKIRFVQTKTPAQMSQQMTDLAEVLAKNLGYQPADILKHVDEASQLSNSSEHTVLKEKAQAVAAASSASVPAPAPSTAPTSAATPAVKTAAKKAASRKTNAA